MNRSHHQRRQRAESAAPSLEALLSLDVRSVGAESMVDGSARWAPLVVVPYFDVERCEGTPLGGQDRRQGLTRIVSPPFRPVRNRRD